MVETDRLGIRGHPYGERRGCGSPVSRTQWKRWKMPKEVFVPWRLAERGGFEPPLPFE